MSSSGDRNQYYHDIDSDEEALALIDAALAAPCNTRKEEVDASWNEFEATPHANKYRRGNGNSIISLSSVDTCSSLVSPSSTAIPPSSKKTSQNKSRIVNPYKTKSPSSTAFASTKPRFNNGADEDHYNGADGDHYNDHSRSYSSGNTISNITKPSTQYDISPPLCSAAPVRFSSASPSSTTFASTKPRFNNGAGDHYNHRKSYSGNISSNITKPYTQYEVSPPPSTHAVAFPSTSPSSTAFVSTKPHSTRNGTFAKTSNSDDHQYNREYDQEESNTSNTSTTKPVSSTQHNQYSSKIDEEEVQFVKVDNKQSNKKRKATYDTSNMMKAPPSDKQRSKLFYQSSFGRKSPQPFELCIHCGNQNYLCHNKVYSTYCTKACMTFLQQQNENDWMDGFNPDKMESIFFNAYNEARRVDIEERFGFYCTERFDIPECMRVNSLTASINMGYNAKLCKDLEDNNAKGKKKYLEARRNHIC